MLEVDNVTVFYGKRARALAEVSLSVHEGEITAIVGNNGAGKSTLLKTISGLIRPSSGSITFYGERIDGLPTYRIVEKGITLVPEGRGLFPMMTVIENLEIGAYTRNAKKKRKENLKKVFEIFPILKKREKQLAGTLSGGEQQMLAIGRGLMSNPKLLMLDEPSLGLAPIITSRMFESIKKINEEGVSILLVEQKVSQSLIVSKRAYVLDYGKVIKEGIGTQLLHDDFIRKTYLSI